MPTYRVSRSIASPADIVWERLSNVAAWPEWLPTVSDVTPLDSTSLQVGARFRVIQPKLRPAVWQVTAIQPGHRFVWEARTAGLAMWANHEVSPISATACDLELMFRFSGFLAPLVALFAGSLTQRYIETEAAALEHWVGMRPRDDSDLRLD